ncbi:hypothetical protein Lal_00006055 [Lupinus albus]|nr:hypothetical protein Lal_00006055 [Lupinus albus]
MSIAASTTGANEVGPTDKEGTFIIQSLYHSCKCGTISLVNKEENTKPDNFNVQVLPQNHDKSDDQDKS